jgi:sugar O-acyltransferase (sialic acid O-acetyltransferase NeuD family)
LKQVVLYGNGTLATHVYSDATKNTPNFNVVAFCVGDDFHDGKAFFNGLPLIIESDLLRMYPPDKFDVLSCIDAPSKVRNRLVVYEKLKKLDYSLISYISPLACITDNVDMGENNIVLAHAHIYPDACLGHSNTIRPTAIVGHDVVIGSGTSVCEGAVIGGYAKVGNSCWLGLNSTINSFITIADDTLVATGAVILSNTKQGTSYVGNPAKTFFSHQETGIMLNYNRWSK